MYDVGCVRHCSVVNAVRTRWMVYSREADFVLGDGEHVAVLSSERQTKFPDRLPEVFEALTPLRDAIFDFRRV